MDVEKGKIVNIDSNKVVVQMEAGSQCQQCGAKHACAGMGGLVRQIEIPANNNVKIGEQVTISYMSQSRVISAVLVFLLPVFFLIAGYSLGVYLFGTEVGAILTTFGGLIVGFILLGIMNKILAHNKHFLPTILKVNE